MCYFYSSLSFKSLRHFVLCIFATVYPFFSFTQIQVDISSSLNKLCDGNGCNYTGPTILINEVMIKPTAGDGSIVGVGPGFSPTQCRGEWIELYNANKCDSIDISCYFLGNNTFDDDQHFGGGYEIPQGTIVPPMGFVILRGEMAPEVPDSLLIENGGNTIEIVLTGDPHVCVGGGYRLWFPNFGGWFAFYSADGHPQDCIFWNDLGFTNLDGHPCIPGFSCPYSGSLASFNEIPPAKKNYIFNFDPVEGRSYRRIPDGGDWVYQQSGMPTMGRCNSLCNEPGLSTCTGKLSATASGGTPPYSFVWNDPAQQTGPAATGLCEGFYCVTVTDMAGNSTVSCDSVRNFVPQVSLDSFPDLCSNHEPIVLTGGDPEGGVFSGPGVFGGVFYPDSTSMDTIIITYTFCDEDSCISAAWQSFRLIQAPEAGFLPVPDQCNNSQPVDFSAQIPAGGQLSGNGVTGTFFYPAVAGQGLHELIMTITGPQGCSDSDTLEIVVNTAPVVSLVPPDTFCVSQDPVLFDFAAPPGGIYTLNNQIITTLFPSNFGTGSYQGRYVYTSQLNGCTDTAWFPVVIRPAPSLELRANPSLICQGEASLLSAKGARAYQWNIDPFITEDTLVVYPDHPTVYSVTATDAPGCFDVGKVSVEVAPTPWFDLGPDRWELFGNEIELRGPEGMDRYRWSTGATEASIVVKTEGTVWLMVETDHDLAAGSIICSASDTLQVGITGCVFVPNAFSPNGNGRNDVFYAKCGFPLLDFEMIILNRWGQIVFQSHDISEGWDGSYQGQPCPYGVYSCIVRFHAPGGTICGKNQIITPVNLLK